MRTSRAGKIRYDGCPNLPARQVVEAQWTAKTLNLAGFVSCQDECSLVVREAGCGLLPAMRACGLGLLPHFPLASGLLTGKCRRNVPLPEEARLAKTQRLADRYLTEKNWGRSEKLIDFAEARGRTPLDLAFSWLPKRSQQGPGARRGRDRGGDQAGAGRGERQGRDVETGRGRPRRDQPDHAGLSRAPRLRLPVRCRPFANRLLEPRNGNQRCEAASTETVLIQAGTSAISVAAKATVRGPIR